MAQSTTKPRYGWVEACGKWLVHNHPPKGRASLSLLPKHPDGRAVDPLQLGICESDAEAIVIARCLDRGAKVEFGNHVTHLLDAGYVEERDLSGKARAQITAREASGPDGEPPRVSGNQQWWCNRDRTMFIVTDEHGSCPMFSFHIEDRNELHPGTSLHQPVACSNGRPSFLPFGNISPVSSYVFGYLEILKERLELNGSLHAPLTGDQQIDVTCRVALGRRREDDDEISSFRM